MESSCRHARVWSFPPVAWQQVGNAAQHVFSFCTIRHIQVHSDDKICRYRMVSVGIRASAQPVLQRNSICGLLGHGVALLRARTATPQVLQADTNEVRAQALPARLIDCGQQSSMTCLEFMLPSVQFFQSCLRPGRPRSRASALHNVPVFIQLIQEQCALAAL